MMWETEVATDSRPQPPMDRTNCEVVSTYKIKIKKRHSGVTETDCLRLRGLWSLRVSFPWRNANSCSRSSDFPRQGRELCFKITGANFSMMAINSVFTLWPPAQDLCSKYSLVPFCSYYLYFPPFFSIISWSSFSLFPKSLFKQIIHFQLFILLLLHREEKGKS